MELRQLNYFKAACELRNFSEAARMLHISQSTLSQQIGQLEEELGILLFDRVGKRVLPTEAGLALLPYASKAIQDAEDGKQMIRDLKGIRTGELHVGVTHSMISLMLPALERFTRDYPHIGLRVTQGTSEELLQQLERHALDFVLSFKPREVYNDFETMHLFLSELYFVVHHSHRLASLSSITLKRLSATPLILPERGFATRTKIEELCRKNRLSLTVGIEMNDVHTILHLLRGGEWGTILTQAAVADEPDLVRVPILCAEPLTSPGYLFWPQGCYRKRAATAFADYLLEVIREGNFRPIPEG